MANEQNLIPVNQRTKSEAREISQKGGIASGKARQQQANLKRAFEALLSSEVNNEQMRDFLIGLGYDPTNEMALALVVLQKALNGDIKAFREIQELINKE